MTDTANEVGAPEERRKVHFRSIFSEVQGLRMHACVGPDPAHGVDRPPVVLVHGLGLSHRYMMPTAQALASSYKVYAPDLPGFGDSQHPRRYLDVAGLAEALARWIEAIALQPAVLVGNSFGCQIIIDCAANWPQRVAAAVLQGPTTPPGERNWHMQYVRWLQNAPNNPPDLSPIAYGDYRKAGYVRTLATFRHSILDRPEEKLARIEAPTLVVRGQRDPICHDRWAQQVADGLPDAALVLIPGVAHTLVYTSPMELAAVTSAFIEDRCRPCHARQEAAVCPPSLPM